MSKASYVQESFLGGQWSPFAQGGFSEREYRRALKVCVNAYPIEEGAWVRRSGFKRGGPTRGGHPARLFKYDFTQSEPITLEFTDSMLRFWRADQIVNDGTGDVVTAVSPAGTDPTVARFTLASDPGWVNGNTVVLSPKDDISRLHFASLANRQFVISAYVGGSNAVFRIADAVTGADVKLAEFTFTGSENVAFTRVLELATPYTPANLPYLRRIATDDDGDNVALICDGVHRPQELTISGDATTFGIAPAVFSNGPYLDPVPGSLITPNGTSGLVSFTLSFQAYSSTNVYNKGDVVTSSGSTYQSLQDVNLNNTPASSPTFWTKVNAGISVGPSGVTPDDIGRLMQLQDSANNWTWAKITALTSSGLINPNLAGSSNIGTMTLSGGLAGAFHGTTQPQSSSAEGTSGFNAVGATQYVGKNWGSSPQAISSVKVYPPSDGAFLKQTYLKQGSSQGPADIGGTLRLFASNTAPASATSGVLLGSVNLGSTQDFTLGTTPVTIPSNDQNTTYKYVWVTWTLTVFDGNVLSHGGQAWCGRIDMFTSAAAAGTAFTAQIMGPALPNTTVINTFAMGAFSDSLGWPKNGCYHEGRLWLAGAIDNRLDGSKSNTPFNFSPVGSSGAVADSNAISVTLNSSDVNPIFWMMPDLQGVLVGTQAGEWILQASNQNNVLTPTSIQAHRITKYGCANAEPVRTGLTTCFIQRFRRRVHEYLSDVFSGKFYAPNLTEKAKDITQSYVQEIDYQEELAPIVWGRNGDGNLIGCTYRRIAMLSHEPPEFRGWHAHAHGSGGSITSMAVGADITGNLDALSVVIQDNSGNCTLQVMQQMFDEEDQLTDASFLDGYLVPAAVQVSGTNFIISGLVPLAGLTAQTVFLGGLDCGDYTVSSTGTITVPFGADPDKLLSQVYLTALAFPQAGNDKYVPVFDASSNLACYAPCMVGSAFTSQGQTLPPMMPEQTGARTGPAFGKVNKHSAIAAMLHTTIGVTFGVDFNKMRPAIFKSRNGKGTQVLRKDQPFTGVHYMQIDDEGVAMDNSICWEITRPYPCTVVAIGGFDGAEDR